MPVQRPGLQPATAAGRQVQARAGRWLECGKSSCAIAWRTLMVSGLLSYDQDPYVIAAGDSCGITDPRRTLMVSRGGGISWTLLVSPVPFGITAEGSCGITDPRRTLMRPQAVAARAYTRAAKSGSAGSLTEKRGSCLSGAVADDRWQCRGLAVRIREQCLDSWGWAGTESRRPWSRRGVNFERHPLSAGSVRVTRQDCVAVSASRSFDR